MNLKSTLGLIGCALLALSIPTSVDAQASPRTCSSRVNPRQGAPTVEQATAYFLCDTEGSTDSGNLRNENVVLLIRDLDLRVSRRSRRANSDDNEYNRDGRGKVLDMNPEKPVYNIRASFTQYQCFSKRNECKIAVFKDSVGICFLDTYDNWHCQTRGNTSSQRLGPWPSAEGESNDRPTNAAIPEPESNNERNAVALPENSASTTTNYDKCIQEIRGRFGYKQGQIITPFSPNFFNIVTLGVSECL